MFIKCLFDFQHVDRSEHINSNENHANIPRLESSQSTPGNIALLAGIREAGRTSGVLPDLLSQHVSSQDKSASDEVSHLLMQVKTLTA